MAARTWLVPLALAAAACGDTLVDRFAVPALLNLCGAGSNFCGGACVVESAASCGPSCADCSAGLPANAGPVCTAAHACDFECSPGWLRSGERCQRATAVAAGYFHTCALAADGKVKCWGANDRGQLGDGTGLDSAVPVDVALPAAASAIATGYAHSCALVSGAIYCWGDNTTGELGDGTTTQRMSPVPVMALSGATLLAAGGDSPPSPYGHTCAAVAGGAVFCWGWNQWGQLGNGSAGAAPVPVPVQVRSLSGATALATGGRHTCALAGGAAFCWGANESGQLGDGSGQQQPSPVSVILTGPTFIATGQTHTCATNPSGLQCWGLNLSGQVDPGSTQSSFQVPHAPNLGGLLPVRAAAGRAHTCALEPPQNLKCFGANASGQLTGSVGGKVDVTLLAPGTASGVAAGGDHTCALTGDGGIQCWGANDRGQLGDGQAGPPVSIPAYVSGR